MRFLSKRLDKIVPLNTVPQIQKSSFRISSSVISNFVQNPAQRDGCGDDNNGGDNQNERGCGQ